MHGYLSNKEAFSAQIAYFSRFFKVTAIDFLGFGKSGALKTPFSVDDYAEWLNEVLAALQIEKPHIIAHSFGCRVAVKAASKKNDRFEKIVLTGAAGIILKRGFSYRFKVGLYRLVKKFAPRYAEKRFGSKEYRSLPPIMKESYKKIVNEDLRQAAKAVKNEVLIVQGEQDRTTTMAEAKIYQAAFPRCVLREIAGGHFAFAENPLLFNLITEEFLYDGNGTKTDCNADIDDAVLLNGE